VPAPPSPLPTPIVDFVAGAVGHRRRFGGGRGMDIAKAVGVKTGVFPSVLDVTAGLGRDGFVLATLGCRVTLIERHPAVFVALRDGLARAREHAEAHDPELLAILDRMTLEQADAFDVLARPGRALEQVIYVDPMFPERPGSAAPKKDIVWLQATAGADADSGELLARVLEADASRVVVKRPRAAAPLGDRPPTLTFQGATSRFDVYPKRAMRRD
jgi:16S rRNA (guanine1516-N2)-methyltransferase